MIEIRGPDNFRDEFSHAILVATQFTMVCIVDSI
jgi:hypothetical protein